MAAMHATTTGTGLTLGAGEDRLRNPRGLVDRFLARFARSTVLDAPEEGALAANPDRERPLRDAALWSTRSSRLG